MEAPHRRHRVAAQQANSVVEAPSTPPPPSILSADDPSATLEEGKTSKPLAQPTSGAAANRKRLSATLFTLVIILLIWRGLVFWAEMSDWEDDESELPPQTVPVKPKKKKMGGDVDVVELKSRSGWSPQTGSLVEKRPPRPCLTANIGVQVFDPVVYSSKDKNWKRRAFACMVKSGCRQGLIEDAEDRRWKRAKSLDVTFIFINENSLLSLPQEAFVKLYFQREGSTYIDTIIGGKALSGGVFEQADARQTYLKSFGCTLNDLNIQLPSYRSHIVSECLEVKDQATKASRLNFHVYSPSSEKSVLLTSSGLLQKLADCKNVQEQTLFVKTTKSLLVDKSKFSVRAFVLVGSTMPFMVFFRRGYVQVSKDEGTGASREMSLEDFQRTLANGKVTGTHFVDTFLKSSMKRIALLLFQASRSTLERRRGSYQLYALDFIVDDQLKVYLDKSIPNPPLSSIQDTPSDASTMIAEMHDLVMELNEEPTAFDSMITGDKYGMFELIFSELRETCEGTLWNPCHQFHDYNSKSLVKANKKISITHNAANREHHEETRIKKKLDEEKKNKCKEQKLSFESKACDKLAKQLEDEEFEKLFAEHEKDWNPNAFKMAKPGEVFPWEIV